MVFREEKRYTAPNAADEAILNEHCHRDVIGEPKPTEKQPTERQTDESLDDNPPPDPPKPKKKSQQVAGLERSFADGLKPPAEGSHWNRSGKDTLAHQQNVKWFGSHNSMTHLF